MNCNKCGQEIPNGSKVCLYCGAKIEVLDVICKCGYKNTIDASFCTECGQRLLQSNSIVPIPNDFLVEYEPIQTGGPDLIVKKSNCKYGCIDKTGKTIVPFIYDDIDFIGHYFMVRKGSKWGLIDKKGEKILNIEYAGIRASGGFVMVNTGNKWNYIDKTGELTRKYDEKRRESYLREYDTEDIDDIGETKDYEERIEDLSGFVRVRKGSKWGLLNSIGIEIVSPTLDYLGNFNNGFAEAEIEGIKGYIDFNGDFRKKRRFQ